MRFSCANIFILIHTKAQSQKSTKRLSLTHIIEQHIVSAWLLRKDIYIQLQLSCWMDGSYSKLILSVLTIIKYIENAAIVVWNEKYFAFMLVEYDIRWSNMMAQSSGDQILVSTGCRNGSWTCNGLLYLSWQTAGPSTIVIFLLAHRHFKYSICRFPSTGAAGFYELTSLRLLHKN